jgi:hypothetical protein
MTARKTYPIDWRSELKDLKPYLEGQGGVVRIIYGGEACAPREFREVVTVAYEDKPDNRKWKSVRIDRGWYTTRLLTEILHEFDRKLSDAGHPPATDPDPTSTINVLAGNEFHDTAEINIDRFSVNDSNPFNLPADRDRRVRAICERLKAFLSAGGRMMVILNHAAAHEQNEFWRHLWHRNLELLVDYGLFLMPMVDRSEGSSIDREFAPASHKDIRLPDWLDESRSNDAYDDLIDILQKESVGLSAEAASAAAAAYLAGNEGSSIKQVHDNLWKLIIRVNESRRHDA